MSVINAVPLLAAAGGDYQISRSVRLRSSASAYFGRTPTSAVSRTTWTWSGWVKRGDLSRTQGLFGAGILGNNANFQAYWDSNNTIYFQETVQNVSNQLIWASTPVYRDISAWYHVVIAMDTTQATAANRAKVYVNGVQIAGAFSVTPAQNQATSINNNVAHYLGAAPTNSASLLYMDGYQAEVNFIDGQQLTASSFGELDAATGVWKPKKYLGTYGTSGYYINFSDSSAATAAAIGKDNSGNGNNWTPNNISVTAGVTYDSMLDVPTNYADGGNGRGNYPVWNVLKRYSANMAFSNANLTVSDTSASATGASASMRTPASGKWYWEVTAVTVSTTLGSVLATTEANADGALIAGNLGYYRSTGAIANLAGTAQTSGATYASGDVIGVAVDVDNGTVQFYKNGTAQGATPSFTFTAGTVIVPGVATDNVAGTKTFAGNFGQRPFTYTPPTGFVALNTQNLPDSTIKAGNKHFDATTYTGTSAAQSIVNGGFQPDLVWFKVRNTTYSNVLLDSLRGSGANALLTDTTGAELAGYANGQITAFNSNGVTINSGIALNESPRPYVAWQWKKGATPGFDIVTYTGNGASSRAITHALNAVPAFQIVKSRTNGTANWLARNKSMTQGYTVYLNLTNPQDAGSSQWGASPPDASNFYVGFQAGATGSNNNGDTYVAYLFSEVGGFSRFGSYTGNSAVDGPFVYCGFRPKFVMVKAVAGYTTDVSAVWTIWDTTRSVANATVLELYPNSSGAEATDASGIDILSNGFKPRRSSNYANLSGYTYIFMAFAENPFKNALAR